MCGKFSYPKARGIQTFRYTRRPESLETRDACRNAWTKTTGTCLFREMRPAVKIWQDEMYLWLQRFPSDDPTSFFPGRTLQVVPSSGPSEGFRLDGQTARYSDRALEHHVGSTFCLSECLKSWVHWSGHRAVRSSRRLRCFEVTVSSQTVRLLFFANRHRSPARFQYCSFLRFCAGVCKLITKIKWLVFLLYFWYTLVHRSKKTLSE